MLALWLLFLLGKSYSDCMTEYITMTILCLCLEYLAAYNRNAAYKYEQSNLGRHNRPYAPLHRWLHNFWFLKYDWPALNVALLPIPKNYRTTQQTVYASI